MNLERPQELSTASRQAVAGDPSWGAGAAQIMSMSPTRALEEIIEKVESEG